MPGERSSSHELPDPGASMRAAIAMADAGIEMTRSRFRREHPEGSPAEIEALVQAWLFDQPPWPGEAEGFRVRTG